MDKYMCCGKGVTRVWEDLFSRTVYSQQESGRPQRDNVKGFSLLKQRFQRHAWTVSAVQNSAPEVGFVRLTRDKKRRRRWTSPITHRTSSILVAFSSALVEASRLPSPGRLTPIGGQQIAGGVRPKLYVLSQPGALLEAAAVPERADGARRPALSIDGFRLRRPSWTEVGADAAASGLGLVALGAACASEACGSAAARVGFVSAVATGARFGVPARVRLDGVVPRHQPRSASGLEAYAAYQAAVASEAAVGVRQGPARLAVT